MCTNDAVFMGVKSGASAVKGHSSFSFDAMVCLSKSGKPVHVTLFAQCHVMPQERCQTPSPDAAGSLSLCLCRFPLKELPPPPIFLSPAFSLSVHKRTRKERDAHINERAEYNFANRSVHGCNEPQWCQQQQQRQQHSSNTMTHNANLKLLNPLSCLPIP